MKVSTTHKLFLKSKEISWIAHQTTSTKSTMNNHKTKKLLDNLPTKAHKRKTNSAMISLNLIFTRKLSTPSEKVDSCTRQI